MAVELDINSLTRVEKGETGFYTAVETDSSIKHASAQSQNVIDLNLIDNMSMQEKILSVGTYQSKGEVDYKIWP